MITNRLSIVEASLNDAPFIFNLMNSKGWLQFIGDRGIKTLKDAEQYIQLSLIDKYRSLGFGLYKLSLRTNDTPIGLCGFVQRDYLNAPDIGFAMLPEFEGNGYMFEAASKIIEMGFSTLNLKTIYGITIPNNTRSIKLLIKLGLSEIDKTTNPKGEQLLIFERKN